MTQRMEIVFHRAGGPRAGKVDFLLWAFCADEPTAPTSSWGNCIFSCVDNKGGDSILVVIYTLELRCSRDELQGKGVLHNQIYLIRQAGKWPTLRNNVFRTVMDTWQCLCCLSFAIFVHSFVYFHVLRTIKWPLFPTDRFWLRTDWFQIPNLIFNLSPDLNRVKLLSTCAVYSLLQLKQPEKVRHCWSYHSDFVHVQEARSMVQ